jgi:hypothetical protein
MKNSEDLFKQLAGEFSSKKNTETINEELGGIVTLKPLTQLTSEDFNPNKQAWETKYEAFVNEEKSKESSLKPIVNTDMKSNTLEKETKVKADPKLTFEMDNKLGGSYKVSDGVENIDSHNYDYKAENINNVNAQEVMTGIQMEISYNKDLTIDEAKELAVGNLSKDPLFYVKEGQFGIKGLGYTESKQQQSDGDTFGGSGFSTKLKDGGDSFVPVKESKSSLKELVKESLGQITTTGNPNSYASQSGNLIKQMMAEREEAERIASEGSNLSYENDEAPAMESAKPDFMDIDGDGDKEESMKKAGKDKAKKPKKETIDSKLAEIGKQGDVVKMEAQINFLDEVIEEKANRLSSIAEDENLSELVDKKKMKDMQKEVKLLEKKKAQMEKVYEKMCGKAYKKMEVVGEMDTNESSEE